MAKTKISEYDATAANNTDIDSINIAEGCAPSGINNAIRELMAHLKDMNIGSTITMLNTTEEDSDGGRANKIIFKGEQSGGEESVLGEIQASHDGSSDDQKGDLIFKTNDGSDGTSPTTAMTIDSAQNVGIGTSSPSTRLHLVPPDNTTANKITQGFGSARANINDVVAGGFDSEFVTRDGNVNTGAFIRVLDVNTNSSFPTTVRGGVLSFGTVDGTDGTSTDADEKMRIDHDGKLLVGKTSAGISGIGAELRNGDANYAVLGTSNGHTAFIANRTSSDGEIFQFRKDNSSFGGIGVSGANNLYISGTQTDHCGFTFATNAILPTTQGTANDNTVDLGASSERFDDVFATNGSIQTSDENEKQDIASLTSAEITAATAINKLFKTFKWKDKVAAKGDNARTHTGVVAQQIQSAMSDAGLDAGNYAFFISSTWWEADEKYTDDDGKEQTRTNIFDTKDEAPEGATERTRLGIRYAELLSFIGAATEQRLTSIEARLDALEG